MPPKGENIKMISFRLNRSRAQDGVIWDYLEQEGLNRSRLIKELLYQSISQDQGIEEIKGKDREQVGEQKSLLQMIKEERKALQTIEDVRERLGVIEKKLSLLSPPSLSYADVDEEEVDLLKTIFEQNPMEIS